MSRPRFLGPDAIVLVEPPPPTPDQVANAVIELVKTYCYARWINAHNRPPVSPTDDEEYASAFADCGDYAGAVYESFGDVRRVEAALRRFALKGMSADQRKRLQ